MFFHVMRMQNHIVYFKDHAKPSDRLSDSSHKFWVVVSKSNNKIFNKTKFSMHVIHTAGMPEICNRAVMPCFVSNMLVLLVWIIHLVKVNDVNPLSANPTKWSNTLKQFVGKTWRIVWVCSTILWCWHLKG